MFQAIKIILNRLTVTLSFSLLAVSAWGAEAGGLKASGFVDAQYHLDRSTPNTFVVNQGAFYLSKELESSKVFIDIPFGHNSADTTNTSNLVFATSQAQAFIKNSHSSGLSWTMGQFDTPYGFELNDTKDVRFSRQGIVFAQMPVTHTGLLLEQSFGSVGLSLLYSNSGGMGHQDPSTTPPTRKPETGLRVSWSSDTASLGGGILMNGYDGKSTVSGENLGTEQLVDITGGMTFNALRVDFAYDMISNKSGETKVTVGSELKSQDPIVGLLVQFAYTLDDVSSIGLRYESVTDAKLSGGTDNQTSQTKTTFGWKYAMNKELTIKADVGSNTEQLSDTAEKKSYLDGSLAALYSF